MFIAARARVVMRALASVPEVRSEALVLPADAHVPSPRRKLLAEAVPLPSLAVATVPLVKSLALCV